MRGLTARERESSAEMLQVEVFPKVDAMLLGPARKESAFSEIGRSSRVALQSTLYLAIVRNLDDAASRLNAKR